MRINSVHSGLSSQLCSQGPEAEARTEGQKWTQRGLGEPQSLGEEEAKGGAWSPWAAPAGEGQGLEGSLYWV